MACNACSCSDGIPNSGFACGPLMKRAYKFVFLQTYDSTNAKNKILFSDTLNQAYFTALINQEDASKRWFPTPALTNPGTARAEAKYFESDSGSKYFLQQGTRSAEAMIIEGAYPQIQGQLEALRCVSELSMYVITESGQLIGKLSDDELSLEPFKLSPQSLTPIFNPLTASEPQHIKLSFDYDISEADSKIRMFDCNEVGGADLLALRGLLDLNIAVSSQTQEGFVLTISTDFGTMKNPVMVTGLTAESFRSFDSGEAGFVFVDNGSSEADVEITVEETSDGVYAVAYDAEQEFGNAAFEVAATGYAVTYKDALIPVS